MQEVGAVCAMVLFCQSLLLTSPSASAWVLHLLQSLQWCPCPGMGHPQATVLQGCPCPDVGPARVTAPRRYLFLTSFQAVFSHGLDSSPKDCHGFLNMSEERFYVHLSDELKFWHGEGGGDYTGFRASWTLAVTGTGQFHGLLPHRHPCSPLLAKLHNLCPIKYLKILFFFFLSFSNITEIVCISS